MQITAHLECIPWCGWNFEFQSTMSLPVPRLGWHDTIQLYLWCSYPAAVAPKLKKNVAGVSCDPNLGTGRDVVLWNSKCQSQEERIQLNIGFSPHARAHLALLSSSDFQPVCHKWTAGVPQVLVEDNLFIGQFLGKWCALSIVKKLIVCHENVSALSVCVKWRRLKITTLKGKCHMEEDFKAF